MSRRRPNRRRLPPQMRRIRRRPLRGGARRARWMPPPPELEAARDDVARAHELMAEGEYLAAGELFSRVAALAAGFQRFERAGHLYLQAGRAAYQGGNLTLAMAHADRAIAAFIEGEATGRATRAVGRLESELRGGGFEEEAALLHDKLESRLAEAGLQVGALAGDATIDETAELPAHCPACLGPVRPDEVEWADETSAVCSYCGSILKAT